jgi:hypothetical protein
VAALICAVVALLVADPFIETPFGAAIAILFIASTIALGLGFFMILAETRIGARTDRIRADVLEHMAEELQPD